MLPIAASELRPSAMRQEELWGDDKKFRDMSYSIRSVIKFGGDWDGNITLTTLSLYQFLVNRGCRKNTPE
jgi:hypothetical protein